MSVVMKMNRTEFWSEFLSEVSERNQAHSDYLKKNLEFEPRLLEELLDVVQSYEPILKKYSVSPKDMAESYLSVNNDMLEARLKFTLSGKYPTTIERNEELYQNDDKMRVYMLGLLMSQFLWVQHARIYRFYLEQRNLLSGNRGLEVGCGHGLHLWKRLVCGPHDLSIDVVDISKASLDLSRELIGVLSPESSNSVNWIHGDIRNQVPPIRGYDFIIMGEVLEHVEKPLELLRKLRAFLGEKGHLFISTCANCPAVDHLFYFPDIASIISMIQEAGYKIIKECVAPSVEGDDGRLTKLKADISYAAVVISG